MNQDCYFVPRSEYWVVAAMTKSVATLLYRRDLVSQKRRALMRLLFGLQRVPRITKGLNVSVEWPDMETCCVIRLDSEHLSIERAHTRLQYCPGSHHMISLYDQFFGAERHEHLENWIPLFDRTTDLDDTLSIEDYSMGQEIDIPPLNEQWHQPMRQIYFDSE